jgi:putative spermidine/putrescine transport system ATP-binding protein
VYAQPANLGVARFMGYRNVLELGVERADGDRVTVAGNGIRLTGVPKQPIAGGRAAVALRPEDIVVGTGEGGVNTISGRVDNVEYCGRDSLVDFVAPDGSRLHARTTAKVAVGDTASFHVPVERALVYPAS